MIEKIIKIIITTFFFLFPLFFLPVTTEFYEYNKMALLILFSFVLLLLLSLKVVKERKLIIHKSTFGLPLFFLAGIILVSTLIQSPNLVVSATTPLSVTTIIAGVLLYFLLVNTDENFVCEPEAEKLMNILILDSVLLSLYTLGLFLGILPPSRSTPAGTLLATAMFLSVMIVYLVIKILLYFKNSKLKTQNSTLNQNKYGSGLPRTELCSGTGAKLIPIQSEQKDLAFSEQEALSSTLIFYLLSLLLILAALILLIFHLLTDQRPLLLPFSFGWMIFLEVIKNIKTLFLGIGPANFITAFTLAKPFAINNTPFWNIIFTSSSSSFLLTLATESGILAAFFYIVILLKSVKLLFQNINLRHQQAFGERDKISEDRIRDLEFILPLILALLLQIFLPSNMTLFILTIILLAFAAKKEIAWEIDLSKLGKIVYVLTLPLILIVSIIFIFTAKFYLAESLFKQSLDHLLNNRGTQAYEKQREAISLVPSLDRYHLVFSQTSLALADALAGKQKLSEEDKQNIPRLAQQSIDQARIAVALYRTNIVNWDNLARTYAALGNFAQGAYDWARETYRQKTILDPVSPQNYLSLGQLFYNQKKYKEAEDEFRQAANLKGDYANARYYLGLTLMEQKKYQEAYREILTAKAFIQKDSPDIAKIDEQLNKLLKLLPPQAATFSAQVPPTASEPQSLENIPVSFQNLPTVIPSIFIPQLPTAIPE